MLVALVLVLVSDSLSVVFVLCWDRLQWDSQSAEHSVLVCMWLLSQCCRRCDSDFLHCLPPNHHLMLRFVDSTSDSGSHDPHDQTARFFLHGSFLPFAFYPALIWSACIGEVCLISRPSVSIRFVFVEVAEFK